MYSISDIEENNFSNNDDNSSNFSDSNNEMKYLKLNLSTNIYTVFNHYKNYNKIVMSSINESNKSSKTISESNKSNITIDENYFQNNEQISEVKVNLFFILSKNFILNASKYAGFLVKGNKIKTKRLVIQKFEIIKDEYKVKFEPKEYVFLPGRSKDLIFPYENNKIKVSKKDNKIIMTKNNELLLNEKNFREKYGFIINEEAKKIIIIQNNSESDHSSENSSKNKNQIKTKSNKSLSSIDDSDKEIAGDKFYEYINDNNYIRYLYCTPEKEIDGMYDQHQKIDLKLSKKVSLEDGIKYLEEINKNQRIENNVNDRDKGKDKGKDNNNDLKCEIIFKNFESSIIEENDPIILEVKQGFNFISILNQVKETSKILGNIVYENKNDIPSTIIGILCNDHGGYFNDQIKNLKKIYKDTEETYLKHITNIIDKNKIRVIIGVIRNCKINDYPLDIEDYNIDNEKLSFRVDIEYANEKMKTNKTKQELMTIKDKFSDKFKSLTYMKKVPVKDLYKKIEEIEKKDEQLEKNKDQLKEKDEQLKDKEEQLEKNKEQLKEKEEQLEKNKDQLKEKDEQLEKKDEQLKKYEEQLKEKDDLINLLKKILEEQKKK